MYEYKCKITRVVDGDTVDVDTIRVLGNELIAIKMEVNDFKMKWLIIGVGTLVALGYAVSSFGPDLMYTFGAM
jgi:endonuclease YncB( thermonuclease family)